MVKNLLHYFTFSLYFYFFFFTITPQFFRLKLISFFNLISFLSFFFVKITFMRLP